MWVALLAGCAAEGPSTETGTLGLCAACTLSCVEEFQAPTSAEHVTGGVEYADPPPSSGDHDPCWARWGVHEEPVPDENWVHNLEHGGVVFLYDCPDGCADEAADLAALATGLGAFAVVTPYAPMPTRYAAVAWGWRYLTDCFEQASFEDFYARHADRAPESNPSNPDAACM
jgi:hypothetical protein